MESYIDQISNQSNNQSNIVSPRASILFRVLRRRFQNLSNSNERTGVNYSSSHSINSSSEEEGTRFSTTLIGVRSLFERIFLGQISFNRMINNENFSLSNNTINLNRTTDMDDCPNNSVMKELLKVVSSCDSEYSDFRTYPLNLDWKEIEKGKSYAYEAMCAFGLVGASIYCNLNRLNNFCISYKKIPKEILEIYTELIKDNTTSYKRSSKIKQFIDELPSLNCLEQIMLNNYTSFKEFLLIVI